MAKARTNSKTDQDRWREIREKIAPLTIDELQLQYNDFLAYFEGLGNNFSVNPDFEIELPDLSERYTETLFQDIFGEILKTTLPENFMEQMIEKDNPLTSIKEEIDEEKVREHFNNQDQSALINKLVIAYRLIMLDTTCRMTYKVSMSSLIQKAKSGDDNALFKALSIDKSLVTTEWISERIRQQTLIDNRDFIGQIATALQKPLKPERQNFHIKLELFLCLIISSKRFTLTDPELCLIIEKWDIGTVNPEQLRQFRNRLGFKKALIPPQILHKNVTSEPPLMSQ